MKGDERKASEASYFNTFVARSVMTAKGSRNQAELKIALGTLTHTDSAYFTLLFAPPSSHFVLNVANCSSCLLGTV